jgi:FKBP-type peptidyl-prolyl cis-trans isomerase SlyD
MQVGKDKIATINYTLKDSDGNMIDKSQDGSFTYLHGAGNIITGLENSLEGTQSGDKLAVIVEPKDGYGDRNDNNVHKVPLSVFPGESEVKPGMSFQATADNGQNITVTVVSVENDEAVVDTNHPLAGVTLHFDVEVLDVRQASVEEISHGHAHGPGSHDDH